MKIPKPLLYFSVIGTIGGGIVLIKDTSRGHKYKGDEQLHGKTVIVTGANCGLGKETAREMAVRGGRVIMACRDLAKCEEARQEIMESSFNKNVHCKKLDLASLASVREFADDILKNEKRLDIMINNAGVMCVPKRQLTEDGFEMHLGVNHLGPFLLTNLLIPKLKESAPSRIVNLTSVAHSKGWIDFRDLNAVELYNKQDRYHMSKLANILFTTELAKNLQGTGVTTYAVHPGVCLTNLGRHMSMHSSTSASIFVKPLIGLVYKQPEDGIQTVIYCALSPELADQSGQYYMECQKVEPSKRAVNADVAKRLWLVSEHWTHLTESPNNTVTTTTTDS